MQAAISVLPCYTPASLCALQAEDSVIKEVLAFWKNQCQPIPEERQMLARPVLLLLRHWDCLVEQEGVLYHRILLPDGGEEVLQLVLPMSLKREVLTQLLQGHGHQGMELTLELVRRRCYWPGMSSDVKHLCQIIFLHHCQMRYWLWTLPFLSQLRMVWKMFSS